MICYDSTKLHNDINVGKKNTVKNKPVSRNLYRPLQCQRAPVRNVPTISVGVVYFFIFLSYIVLTIH